MKPIRYAGAQTKEISFPLGGIGTGCIGLAGNGRLLDWEIFNRPNKESVNGFSHFAVRVEERGRLVDARVLQGDLPPPYSGSHNGTYSGFGFGPQRATLGGLPHFRKVEFSAAYPLANLEFRDPHFPGHVALTAFNPYIPLDARHSGIPGAFFEFVITNTTRRTLTYAVAGTLANPLPAPNLNRVVRRASHSALVVGSRGVAGGELCAGDLCLATDAEDVSGQPYWFGGAWFDALEVYWKDLTTPGALKADRSRVPKDGKDTHGTLLARVVVPPGQSRRVRYVLTWSFPVRENYWNTNATARAKEAGISPTWRNYYSTIWRDSEASARESLRKWDWLAAETHAFRDALLDSTLPAAALDAVTANLSILKTPTTLRLEDGTFYGFEGCHAQAGCCEGTCTHVWNYAQALPYLFPDLERTVRDVDYRYNLQPNGGMPFRLNLPLGLKAPPGRSCADGLLGNVMMVYRDWKITGDSNWLRALWPDVKKSLAFAWEPTNEDRWDPDQTGVLWGRQHHTLDMEFFGPSSWLCGFYLGALKAASEMADHLGDTAHAELTRKLFARGKAWVDKHLFNGEFYFQRVDLNNRRLVKSFDADGYWDREHGEIKYQIGEGCAIDQTLAQWHANIYGLGELFDARQARSALGAIYRHNYKPSLREHANPCRLYGLNDESGSVICEWPKGRLRPVIPVPYSQETMHGFEYAAACQMIQNGMLKEGEALVRAVRDRYDGERRNPWNEFECGSNYARSMASYALLQAYSGFQYDAVQGRIGFSPVHETSGVFRCFWCVASGWGRVESAKGKLSITVQRGFLEVKSIGLPLKRGLRLKSVRIGGKQQRFVAADNAIALKKGVMMRAGQSLELLSSGIK